MRYNLFERICCPKWVVSSFSYCSKRHYKNYYCELYWNDIIHEDVELKKYELYNVSVIILRTLLISNRNWLFYSVHFFLTRSTMNECYYQKCQRHDRNTFLCVLCYVIFSILQYLLTPRLQSLQLKYFFF